MHAVGWIQHDRYNTDKPGGTQLIGEVGAVSHYQVSKGHTHHLNVYHGGRHVDQPGYPHSYLQNATKLTLGFPCLLSFGACGHWPTQDSITIS